MSIKSNQDTLNAAISALILSYDDNSIITDETRKFMVRTLSDLVCRASIKFIAGQAEHGGNFLGDHVDHRKELSNEFYDFIWYDAGERAKTNLTIQALADRVRTLERPGHVGDDSDPINGD